MELKEETIETINSIRHNTDHNFSDDAGHHLEEWLGRAKRGELRDEDWDWDNVRKQKFLQPTNTNDRFACARSNFFIKHYIRDIYTTEVSWSILTKEYIDSLAKLFWKKRVVELFAGNGWLAKVMGETYIRWHAYDSSPGNNWVGKMSTEDWLKEVDPLYVDAVFASWIPNECSIGTDILRWCKKNRKPFFWIGEGEGGCTGTEQFWADMYEIGGFYFIPGKNGYPYVHSWSGMGDFMSVWFPDRQSAEEFTGKELIGGSPPKPYRFNWDEDSEEEEEHGT